MFGFKFWQWWSARRRWIPSSRRSGAGWGFLQRGSGLRPHRDRSHRHAESSVAIGAGSGGQTRSPAWKLHRRRWQGSSCAARTSRRATTTRRKRRARRSRTAGSTPATSASSTPKGGSSSRGRKKEMIVTPEGLNVFPEDVEQRAERAARRASMSAVVGAPVAGQHRRARAGGARCSTPGTDADAVVRAANAALADHQKIRAAAVWPGTELPAHRGHAQAETARAARVGASARASAGARRAVGGTAAGVAVLERFAPGRTIRPATTIDELGLSSLERVELMMALEEALPGRRVDEAALRAGRHRGRSRSRWRVATGVSRRRLGRRQARRSRRAPIALPVVEPLAAGAAGAARSACRPGSCRSDALFMHNARRRAGAPGGIIEGPRGAGRQPPEPSGHAGHSLFCLAGPMAISRLPRRWLKEFFRANFVRDGQHRGRKWLWNSLWYYLGGCQSSTRFRFRSASRARDRPCATWATLERRLLDTHLSRGPARPKRARSRRFLPRRRDDCAPRLGVPVVPVRLDGLDRVLPRHARVSAPRARAACAFGAPLSCLTRQRLRRPGRAGRERPSAALLSRFA